MITDIYTVALKEWKEMLKGGSRGRFASFVLVAIYGIIFPGQAGRGWFTDFQSVAFAVILPLFIVFSVVADAFAGERERHTLETLLASRLSDRAILIGKVVAVTVYGWGLTMVSLLLGALTVNVSTAASGFGFYPGKRFLALVCFSLLTAVLAAGLGVLVSLRAATVRQAQQTLTISWLVAVFGGVFAVRDMSSATRDRFIHWLNGIGIGHAAIYAGVIILAVDAVLIVLALARFQRARLILD